MTRPSNKTGLKSAGPSKAAFIHPSHQATYRMDLKKTAYDKMKQAIQARKEKQLCR